MTTKRVLIPWHDLKELPLRVWVVAIVTLVNRMGTMVLPFLVLYLTEYQQLSASTAGLALIAYGVGGLVSAPLAGRLCDRYDAFRVMEGSLVLGGVLLFIYPFFDGLQDILVLTFIWSIISEAVRPATLVALSFGLTSKSRKTAMALNRLAINVGMSIGPAAAGFLAAVSYPILFVVDGITAILAGLILAFVASRYRLIASSGSEPFDEGRIVNSTEPQTEMVLPVFDKASLVSTFINRRSIVFLTTVFLVGVVFMQHNSSLPVFLVQELSFSTKAYGMLFVVNTALIVLLELPLNLALAHWTYRRTLLIGSVLMSIGFGAFALVSGLWGVIFAVVLWTFGEMMLFPVLAAYAADIAQPGQQGIYMGAYTMAYKWSFIVGPWAGTMLFDYYGSVVLWSVMFAVGMLATGIILLIRE
jgi:MFS family permease